MVVKLFRWVWSVRYQFLKYFITGVSAAIFDMGSLYLLKEFAGMNPVVAVVINQIFIINYVFFINKYWSFHSNGMTGRQIFRFLLLSCWNYLFAISWMWLFNNKIGINYLLVRIANIILAVSWNFLLYKYFVFKIEQASDPVNNGKFIQF